MSSTFSYYPLDSKKSEIRLIQLIPDDTKVAYKLSTVSLNDNPVFTALSYVWGDPTITKQVLLDGHAVQVTTNLAAALRSVPRHWETKFPGHASKSLRLWVDAICIDQSNIAERNSQVKIMGSIYSNADLVISWLGCGDEQIVAALGILRIIAKENKDVTECQPLNLQWIKQYPGLRLGSNRIDRDGENSDVKNQSWPAIIELLNLDYWRRVWIFQEVVLGRKVLITYDAASLEYQELVDAFYWFLAMERELQSKPYNRPDFIDKSSWSCFAGNIYRYEKILLSAFTKQMLSSKGNHDKQLSWIMSLGGNFESTDPRDHIYGMLGLTRSRVIPDYNKSITEVYRDFLHVAWKDTGVIGFLDDAGVCSFEQDRDRDLPSWIPQYKAMHNVRGTCVRNFTDLGDWKVQVFDASVDPNIMDKKLFAQSLVVSNVSRIHPLSTMETGPLGLLDFVLDFVHRRPIYITGIQPLDALFRLLWNVSLRRGSDELLMAQVYSFLMHITADNGIDPFSPFGVDCDSAEGRAAFVTSTFLPSRAIGNVHFTQLAYNEIEQTILSNETTITKFIEMSENLKQFYRFCETEEGFLGLTPKDALPGDLLSVIKGADSLFLLRKIEEHYIIIGTCFFVGLMDGEIVEMRNRGELVPETLEIW